MQTQNFKNHSQLAPLFHYVLFGGLLILLIGSIVNVIHSSSDNLYSASLLVLSTILIILTAFLARTFALKAQDRAIRSEEQLRFFILTGKPMDKKLTLKQIIALRFASDEEFVALAQKAVDENLSSKNIKMAITQWRGDYHRV